MAMETPVAQLTVHNGWLAEASGPGCQGPDDRWRGALRGQGDRCGFLVECYLPVARPYINNIYVYLYIYTYYNNDDNNNKNNYNNNI
jgi:hypothetical protein